LSKVKNTDIFKQKAIKDNIAGYLFLFPALTGFIIFIAIPVILSFVLSFFDYNLIATPKFLGLGNYRRVIKDPLVIKSFLNTFKFFIILVPVHAISSVLLAYFVYKAKRFKTFYRSAIYFPSIVTTASVAIAWSYMFATDTGILNYYVKMLGFSSIPWLTDSTVVYITIAIFSFWKFVGTAFLYCYIGLQNIPDVYYEASRIDGANSIQTFSKITLPLLSPTLFFVVTTLVINVFQIFDEPFFLTGGGPGTDTRTVALHIYEVAFKQMKTGLGSTISLILFIIILVITIVQFSAQKKWVVYDYE